MTFHDCVGTMQSHTSTYGWQLHECTLEEKHEQTTDGTSGRTRCTVSKKAVAGKVAQDRSP
jgi:hypothetical protein